MSTRNLQRILRRYVRPGMAVLEVGFAPGKHLLWVERVLGARVAGLDYSEAGVSTARELFRHFGAAGDLRCADIFGEHFDEGSFDVVYSVGLIEHFDDPRAIVRRHVLLARPAGGVALLIIPNYRSFYGRLQARLDGENLEIHNTRIMNPDALAAQVPQDMPCRVSVTSEGRMDPWLLSFDKKLPGPVAVAVFWLGNAVGLAQPLDIPFLCPWLALVVRRG